VRGIAKVEQPIASFGGSPAEDPASLKARTSARLRHKQRGITSWDVERLLLERFPQIARVRLLPARATGGTGAPGVPSPGHMLAIVVPAADGPVSPDPLRPLAGAALRGAIADWLGRHCSPFARIHVVDPLYEPVDIRVTAFFGAARDGSARLERDLLSLLSPWTEAGLDLPDEAGPRALQARIGRFVRTRPYVAAVESVTASLAGSIPIGEWRVPVAGTLDVTALARAPAGC
jgi:hypothetical protein